MRDKQIKFITNKLIKLNKMYKNKVIKFIISIKTIS